jgi:hypothetical protein
MDSERFDGLVRTFGQARSRRQTLLGLTGAAVGALALGGWDVSADECKGVGKACKKSSQCCGTLECVDSGSDTNSPKKNSNTCQEQSTCIGFGGACVLGEHNCCQEEFFVFDCIETVIGVICTGIGPR